MPRGGEVGLYIRPATSVQTSVAPSGKQQQCTKPHEGMPYPCLEDMLPYGAPGPLAWRWLFWSSQATLGKIKVGRGYRPPSILTPASIARPDRFVVG